MSQPLIQLIAGPTASGKSRLALETAERTGAVILNADSQQLYVDLRILSARPTAEDEARTEHRLYGIADAADAWSVGRWSRAVMPVLAELAAEGRSALLVGGTGLYFNALTRGLADIPDIPDTVRDEIGALYDTAGEGSVRRRLVEADPESEAAIAAGDRQRLIRALAVLTVTGQPLSVWRADTRPLLTEGSWTAVVIEPPRDRLYAACDARVAAMVEHGALDEVRALSDPTTEPDPARDEGRRGARFRRPSTRRGQPADAITAVQQATRNYAKRQLTWFRNQTPRDGFGSTP